jgi:hypothetical protein
MKAWIIEIYYGPKLGWDISPQYPYKTKKEALIKLKKLKEDHNTIYYNFKYRVRCYLSQRS